MELVSVNETWISIIVRIKTHCNPPIFIDIPMVSVPVKSPLAPEVNKPTKTENVFYPRRSGQLCRSTGFPIQTRSNYSSWSVWCCSSSPAQEGRTSLKSSILGFTYTERMRIVFFDFCRYLIWTLNWILYEPIWKRCTIHHTKYFSCFATNFLTIWHNLNTWNTCTWPGWNQRKPRWMC